MTQLCLRGTYSFKEVTEAEDKPNPVSDFPGGRVVKTLLPLQRTWIPSLARELRSHMPRGMGNPLPPKNQKMLCTWRDLLSFPNFSFHISKLPKLSVIQNLLQLQHPIILEEQASRKKPITNPGLTVFKLWLTVWQPQVAEIVSSRGWSIQDT